MNENFFGKAEKRIFVILKFEAYFQRNVESFVKKINVLKTFRAINDVFLGTHLLCNKLRRKEEHINLMFSNVAFMYYVYYFWMNKNYERKH